jgi:thiamine-monophosphate kinase
LATVKPIGEFDLIARLSAHLPTSSRTILGVGDDCAVVAPTRNPQLITIDSMIEGVHFRRNWSSPEALGARALTVNLSDVAAMGGVPTFCVINLAVSPGLEYQFFDRLYDGLRAAAREAKVDIVGGNITRGEQLAITVALIGETRGGVMRRDQARVGDAIYVTGTVGDAGAGLRLLEGSLKARGWAREFLIGRLLAPSARLAAGLKLARLRPPPAAIDISDGLWQDLGHILAASRVGAEIDAEAVPLSPAYRAVVGSAPGLALSGGDDYELLFCTSAPVSAAALARRLRVSVTRIGTIVKRRGARLLNGEVSRFAGWDQLGENGG